MFGKEKPMQQLMAIDPGASGGIAWTDGDVIRCAPMPEGMTAQADFIRSIRTECRINRCIIEKLCGYVPGNGGASAATFARHCGGLEAMLYCMGIPTEQVAPAVWQKAIGMLPKDKQERKRAIKEAMARRYPHLSVTLKTADALGILGWEMGRI